MTSTQRTLVRTLALSLPPRDPAGNHLYVEAVRSTFQLIAAFPAALKCVHADHFAADGVQVAPS